MNSFLKNYLIGATGFSAIYKTGILWDAKIQTYDNNYKNYTRPLFLGEKLLLFSASMAYSPLLAPVWAANCLDHIDIRLRGKKPEDYHYGTKPFTSWFDHIIA